MKKSRFMHRVISAAMLIGLCGITHAALPADPPSAPITLGQWHGGLQKGLDYSDAQDIPLVLVWGDPGCSNCAALDKQLDSATFKEWQGRRGLVMIYVKNNYGSWESKWSRGISPYTQQYVLYGYPYVAVYWKSKNTKAFNFEGKGMKAAAVITKIESYITEYSSADLTSLEIIGPSIAGENLTVKYECVATYSNGGTKSVTAAATWQEDSAFTTISAGNLAVGALNANGQVAITASYTDGTIQKSAVRTVTLADKTMAGIGSAPNPYQITSLAEFLYMAYNTAEYGKHYKLMADIDLGAELFVRSVIAPNGASGSTYTGTPFSGVFNGNGHIVRNIAIITIQKNESNLGLFGRLSGGSVLDLGVENISIVDSSATAQYVGGFCGQSRDSSTISGCYVDGAEVEGLYYVGGFIGVNKGSSIDNSSAGGSANSGSNFAGGFCGRNESSGTLTKCYAATSVSGAGTKGGFCASAENPTAVVNSFWDTQVSGIATSSGGTGKTTAQMQTKATYTAAGWDFTEVWGIEPNDYPFLLSFGGAPEVRYSGGMGTELSPYRISNKEDLSCLATNTPDYDKWFVLTADIDLAGEVYTTAVIAPDAGLNEDEFTGEWFTGSFDGGGYSVDNLSIDAGSTGNDFLALFGGNQGRIKSLKMRNANVKGGDGSIGLAVLCAHNLDACSGFSQITQCSVEGFVTGASNLSGGLCAFNQGPITQSSADVLVTGGDVSGGFCARNFCGEIIDCISKGSVSGTMRVAGFCAENSGLIDRCYSIAPVSAASEYAGFCYTNAVEDGCGMCGPGGEVYTGAVSNSFWDVVTSRVAVDGSAEGKTPSEMGLISTFTAAGWDFDEDGVWYMNAYPELNVFYQDYTGGSGTESDPFVITTKRDFMNFAGNTADYDKYFELASDIDLAGEIFPRAVIAANAAGGGGTYSGVAFTGTFDGNGHVVRNINITTSQANESNLGLFGRLIGATVTCLGIENITVTDSSGSALYVGGFCGQNFGSIISKCYVENADLQAQWYVGGFVGVNRSSAMISDCFASGAVKSGSGYGGGFCGFNQTSGTLAYSYSTTAVTGVGTKGGFCASSDGTAAVTACVWNTTTSGQTVSVGGVGKTTAQMQTESTYTGLGWDFTDVWSMDGYPELRCFCQSSGACAQLIVVGGNGSGVYSNGMEIAISAVIPSNYIFRQWSAAPVEFAGNIQNYLDANTTFTMPAAGPVELMAHFMKRPDVVPTYAGAQPNQWTMDYDAALAYAEEHDLPTIFMFTGAWWCPDCHTFDPGVLENPLWLDYLDNNPTMLVMLDYEVRRRYGFPRTHLINHCFLWDEKFLADNNLSPAEAEARLEVNHLIEAEYKLPSKISVNYPTFVVHRPDGSRAGRMGLERVDNPSVTNVIRWIGQALASDPADELDDEALMSPPTLDIPADESASEIINATLSEIDLADNYRFEAFAGSSYTFSFGGNAPYPAVPLSVSILAANGTNVVNSAAVNPAIADSCTFAGLPTGIYFLKVAAQSPVSGQVGYSMHAARSYPYSGGLGTVESPYLIGDADDLMELSATTDDYSKNFTLISDIDLLGRAFARAVIAPNAAGSYAVYTGVPFTGVFDGNGYVIRNVQIVTIQAAENNIGLFGRLSGTGCEVRRLEVENITVLDASKTARYVGGLCGQLRDGAAIKHCAVVNADLEGQWYVGGLVGVVHNATVHNCFAMADVKSAQGYCGGFCGIAEVYSHLENCYAAGTVVSTGLKGGFNPSKDATSSVTGCFWDTTISGLSASAGGGTGRTTSQMQTLSTFTGAAWDFVEVWYMGDGYPSLKWLTPEGSYQRWLGAQQVPLANAGEGDTPAGDGIPNLLKFASGLPALTPATTADLMGFPSESNDTMFEVLFYRAQGATGVELEPLYAESLDGSWAPAYWHGDVDFMEYQGEREVWKVSIPRANHGFIKLSAEQRDQNLPQ